MTRPAFEAVFWDIGGVILRMDSVRDGYRQFVTALTESHETQLSPREAVETWRTELRAYFDETEGTNYRPARAGYRRAVDAIVAADADTLDWETLLAETYTDCIEPNPGAVETIDTLADTPVHQGVVSDVDEDEGERVLKTLGVYDQFDAVTTSGEVGRKKPDPVVFETALDRAGVEASDAVMVGDRYEHDMEGGNAVGLTTVAYGSEDGPAVDHVVDDLGTVLSILGVED